MVAARGWGEGNGESVSTGSEMQLCKIKTVSEMDCGNGSIAIRMSFVPKNLHLKGLSQCILRYVYFTTKEKLEKKGDKEYHLRFKTENGI